MCIISSIQRIDFYDYTLKANYIGILSIILLHGVLIPWWKFEKVPQEQLALEQSNEPMILQEYEEI